MTAPLPLLLAGLPGLHVVFGDRWKEPTADYRCACGWSDSASGPAAVIAFVNTARRVHLAVCRLRSTT